MLTPDLINGLFEFAGAVAGVYQIWVLHKHKKVRGFAPLAYLYFTAWGMWNCFYYPHLDQWVSLVGTIAITLSNGIYAAQAVYYIRREKQCHQRQHASHRCKKSLRQRL